jgi:hypothetical protein
MALLEASLMGSRLFRNIWLKVSALLLAVLTWWSVHNSMETSEDFTYNVRLLLPPNIKAKVVTPALFIITVSGPNENVKAFHSVKHEYLIDLTTFKGSETTVQVIEIDKSAMGIPPTLSIKAVSNQKITITLDPLIQKELKVECDITDKPAPGYIITGKSVRPSHLMRELPSKDAKSIDSIKTVPITVSAATTSINDKVALIDPIDSEKRLDVFVDVLINIEEDLREIEVKDIPVLVLKSPADKKQVILETNRISVTLRGRKDIIETFDKAKLLAFLDVTKQQEGEYNLQPLVFPIEGITQVKTESVKYTIKP